MSGAEVVRVPRLQPITQSAVDATVAQVQRDHANAVGVKASTAGGGQAQVFLSVQHRQLSAAGYAGWQRGAGVVAGGEATWKLGAR